LKKELQHQSLYSSTESKSIYMRAVLFNVGFQLFVGFLIALFAKDDTVLKNIFVNLSLMVVIQIAILLAVISKDKKKFLQVKTRLQFKKQYILLGVAIAMITFVGFMSSNMYFFRFLSKFDYNFNTMEFEGVFSVFLGFVVICISAPIVEEIVFRFGVLDGLRSEGQSQAVLFCAVAFAFMHMSPEQTFYQFALGLVAGIFVLKTGSLLVGIVVHMTNNILSFVLGFIPSVDSAFEYYFAQWYSILISVVLALCAALVLFFLHRKLKAIDRGDLPQQDSSTIVTVVNKVTVNINDATTNVENYAVLQSSQKQSLSKVSNIVLLVFPLLLCVTIWIIQLVGNLS